MVDHVEVGVSVKGKRVEKSRVLIMIQVIDYRSIILILKSNIKREITGWLGGYSH